MSLAKTATKIGKLSTIYLIGSFLPQVINMLVLPVYTDYLSKEQMGIFSLANRVGGPLSVVIQLGVLVGLKSWFFRVDEPLRPQLIRTVQVYQFGINATVVLLLALGGWFFVETILPGLPLPWMGVYLLWLLILVDALGDASTRLATMVTRLCERAKASVAIGFSLYVLQLIFSLAIVLYLANAGEDGWLGFGRKAGAAAAAVVMAVFAASFMWRFGRGPVDRDMAKRTLRTGITFVPHQLSDHLTLSSNAWMLNGLFSTAALGVYGVAVSFAVLIQMPLFNFSDAAYPTLSRLMREGGDENRRQQARIYTLTLLIIIVAMVGQYLFATLGIRVLTNPSYHEAAEVVPILIFAWLFQAFYLIVVQPVFFFGGGVWLSTATVLSVIVSIVFGAWAIPEYGMYGAAWAMVVAFVTKFLVAASASMYLYPLPWEISKFLRALACAAIVVWVDLTFVDGAFEVVTDVTRPGSFFERVEWIPLTLMVGLKLVLLASMVPLLWLTGTVKSRELIHFRDAVRGKLRTWFGR
jgi:O-antigen/teichoic acid export membrane protein